MWDTRSCTDQPGHPLSLAHTASGICGHNAKTALRSSSIALSAPFIQDPSFHIDTYGMYEDTDRMYLGQGGAPKFRNERRPKSRTRVLSSAPDLDSGLGRSSGSRDLAGTFRSRYVSIST